tara:strand:- start:619 stop:2211 length:1593 start_codon:yes stop_codon:yes gene_type:complete
MALQYLHDINLNDNELQNAKLHVTDSAPSSAAGQIYFHSTSGTVRVHNGSGWETISTDTTDDFITYSTSVVSSSGIKLRLTGVPVSGSNTTDDVKFTGSDGITVTRTDASTINFAGQVYVSSDWNHDDLSGFVANEHIDWTTDQGATNIHTGNYENTQLSNSEVVAAVVASTSISSSDKTTIRSNIGAGTSSLALGTTSTTALAGNTSLLQLGTSSTTALAGNTTVNDVSVANLKTRLAGGFASNAVQIGDSTDTVTIPGNLVVTGDTTYSNETIQIVEDNTLAFRAGDGNAFEILLTASDATGSDKTITLPNATGTVALTSQITGTNSGTNTGDEVAATTTVAGIVELATNTEANAGTDSNRALTPANLAAFTGSSNITTLGTINSGTWNGSAISTSYISNLSGTNTGDEPNATVSVKGIVELATAAEVVTGTDSTRAVTPSTLRAAFKAVTITGNASATSFNVDHNFGLADLIDVSVQVVDSLSSSATYGQTVIASVDRTTANRVVVSFGSAPANGQTYKVHCVQMGV